MLPTFPSTPVLWVNCPDRILALEGPQRGVVAKAFVNRTPLSMNVVRNPAKFETMASSPSSSRTRMMFGFDAGVGVAVALAGADGVLGLVNPAPPHPPPTTLRRRAHTPGFFQFTEEIVAHRPCQR